MNIYYLNHNLGYNLVKKSYNNYDYSYFDKIHCMS